MTFGASSRVLGSGGCGTDGAAGVAAGVVCDGAGAGACANAVETRRTATKTMRFMADEYTSSHGGDTASCVSTQPDAAVQAARAEGGTEVTRNVAIVTAPAGPPGVAFA